MLAGGWRLLMMVLHVFPERDTLFREEHLKYWFGYPDMGPHYDPNNESQVCYCGASMVKMDEDTVAVWHMASYTRDYWKQ